MANDYIEYLSANVLNDGQTVSEAALILRPLPADL
jgi:hypothetical protein